MKRRSALKTLSLGFGYTMTAAGLGTLAISCQSDPTKAAADTAAKAIPSLLSSTDLSLVEDLLDMMLPKTDAYPGYKEVKAIGLVDGILTQVYKKKDQDEFMAGFGQIATMIKEGGDTGLADFMKKHMVKTKGALAERMEKLVATEDEQLSPEGLNEKRFHTTLSAIRNLGIASYFSNQTIATEHLSYDPIPGTYDGCIPVGEVGNSWSLS